jgi:hypothetical protein
MDIAVCRWKYNIINLIRIIYVSAVSICLQFCIQLRLLLLTVMCVMFQRLFYYSIYGCVWRHWLTWSMLTTPLLVETTSGLLHSHHSQESNIIITADDGWTVSKIVLAEIEVTMPLHFMSQTLWHICGNTTNTLCKLCRWQYQIHGLEMLNVMNFGASRPNTCTLNGWHVVLLIQMKGGRKGRRGKEGGEGITVSWKCIYNATIFVTQNALKLTYGHIGSQKFSKGNTPWPPLRGKREAGGGGKGVKWKGEGRGREGRGGRRGRGKGREVVIKPAPQYF